MNVRHEHRSWGSCTDRMRHGVYKAELFRDSISEQGAKQDMLGFLRSLFRKRMLCGFTMRIAPLMLRQSLDMSPALTCFDGERKLLRTFGYFGRFRYILRVPRIGIIVFWGLYGVNILFASFQTAESFPRGDQKRAHEGFVALCCAPHWYHCCDWVVGMLAAVEQFSPIKSCQSVQYLGDERSRSEKPCMPYTCLACVLFAGRHVHKNRMLAMQRPTQGAVRITREKPEQTLL